MRERGRLHDEVEAVTASHLMLIRVNHEENGKLILAEHDLAESQSMFRLEEQAVEGAKGSIESNNEDYYTELSQA